MMVRIAKIFVWLAAINFLLFFAGAMWLGGDAANGNARNGHYFLREHGHSTEVSQAVFTYSEWHANITIFSMLIALFVNVALRLLGHDPVLIRRRSPRDLRN
jgi:TRAP-type C4-dicarboxylate transport system permease small subunit